MATDRMYFIDDDNKQFIMIAKRMGLWGLVGEEDFDQFLRQASWNNCFRVSLEGEFDPIGEGYTEYKPYIKYVAKFSNPGNDFRAQCRKQLNGERHPFEELAKLVWVFGIGVGGFRTCKHETWEYLIELQC